MLKLKLPQSQRHYAGLTASLVLHGMLIGLLVAQGDRLWSRTLAPGDPALRAGANAAAGGGPNRVAYITLPSIPEPEAPAVPRVPAPVPPPKPVEIPAPEPEQPKTVTPALVDTVAAEALARQGPAAEAGPGAGSGSGPPGEGQSSGTGGGAGGGPGGEGGKIRPPEPRDMAFPFDTPPKELRGVSLNVTFWVRVDGRVERYTVEPEIKDRDYAKKFDEVMRAFRFTPARAPDGTRVPGTARISFTLPGKSSS
jgi:periplasmic protein TonB